MKNKNKLNTPNKRNNKKIRHQYNYLLQKYFKMKMVDSRINVRTMK